MSVQLLHSRTIRFALENELAIRALKESTATALKLADVTVRIEESALHDSQSNGLTKSAVKDVKGVMRTNLACLVRLRTRVFRITPSLALACEILCCDGEQMQERSRRQGSL